MDKDANIKHCHGGFLSKGSTLLQVLKRFDQWTLALDKETEADSPKTFNSVPRRRPVCIPQQNSIIGPTQQWLEVSSSREDPRE